MATSDVLGRNLQQGFKPLRAQFGCQQRNAGCVSAGMGETWNNPGPDWIADEQKDNWSRIGRFARSDGSRRRVRESHPGLTLRVLLPAREPAQAFLLPIAFRE
jgi:hypothetical protein